MTDAREACAERLEELAGDPRFAGRSEDLQSIAGALRNQLDGAWTGVDLVSAFPTDASIDVHHSQLFERFFGMAAGFSVFVPVAWTWLHLRAATNAYDDYLRAHTIEETAGQTFLGLWTTGFEGRLAHWHQFGPMAWVSLMLIVGAAASIVLHRLLAEWNISRDEHATHDARRALVIQLVRAQRFLNERRTDDPKFLEDAIKRSVAELIKAQKATRQGVEALGAASTRAVEELGAASSNAQEATRLGVEALGAASTRAAEELGAASSKAVNDLNSVSSRTLRQLDPLLAATTKVGENLSESAAAVLAAQQQVSSATADIQLGVMNSLAQFASSLGQTHADMSGQISAAITSLNGSVEQVAAAKEAWEKALTEGLSGNGRAVEDVSARMQDFVSLLRDHESTLQSQANQLSRAADLSSQVLNELRQRAEGNGTGL